jgi:hypothetical protein
MVGIDSVAKEMIADMKVDSRQWQTDRVRHCGYGKSSPGVE